MQLGRFRSTDNLFLDENCTLNITIVSFCKDITDNDIQNANEPFLAVLSLFCQCSRNALSKINIIPSFKATTFISQTISNVYIKINSVMHNTGFWILDLKYLINKSIGVKNGHFSILAWTVFELLIFGILRVVEWSAQLESSSKP